jgi:hypothetical protein
MTDTKRDTRTIDEVMRAHGFTRPEAIEFLAIENGKIDGDATIVDEHGRTVEADPEHE